MRAGAVVEILDGDAPHDGDHLPLDPHFLLLALFFLLLDGLQALREFGQSETLERLHAGLAVESGEQAGIGSLEDFDLTFDPLGEAVFPVFFLRDGQSGHGSILVQGSSMDWCN